MAGTYGQSVPDPSDTSNDVTNVSPISSFDELTQFGVSPNLANIPVPIARRKVKGQAPAGERSVQVETDVTDHLSYQEATQALYGKTPDELQQLQLGMAAAGFYGKNPYFTPRTPDKNTWNTWDMILKMSMRTGKTPDELIQEGIDANGGLEEGLKKVGLSGTTGSTADVAVTHPDDIRMVAKEVSRKVLGKGWDDKQLAAFVHTYQGMESAAGNAAQAQGAHYTNPPSVEAAATEAARASNPTAAGATDWDNAAQMMMQAFKVLGGGNA